MCSAGRSQCGRSAGARAFLSERGIEITDERATTTPAGLEFLSGRSQVKP